jgi:hypothetical protein
MCSRDSDICKDYGSSKSVQQFQIEINYRNILLMWCNYCIRYLTLRSFQRSFHPRGKQLSGGRRVKHAVFRLWRLWMHPSSLRADSVRWRLEHHRQSSIRWYGKGRGMFKSSIFAKDPTCRTNRFLLLSPSKKECRILFLALVPGDPRRDICRAR